MIESDTVKLLRECDAGIKMGVSSIDDVLDYVGSKKMKECLNACKNQHTELQNELDGLLHKYHDEGKEPNPVAKGMSRIKSNVKLVLNDSDRTIADLVTDGCNMGVKSLNRYLNQYEAADEVSKDITKRLINAEERLAVELRSYL